MKQEYPIDNSEINAFFGTTPWEQIFHEKSPVYSIKSPTENGFMFATCSGSSPVISYDHNFAGMARFRFAEEDGKPTIKRYELGVYNRGGSFIGFNMTHRLGKDHHIQDIRLFPREIFEALPLEYRLKVEEYLL